MKNSVKPYSATDSKREQVERMFDNIAPRYDFLNHFLSLGIDKLWRRRAIKQLKNQGCKRVLDVATGTGDMAIKIYEILGCEVVGTDISDGMLQIGKAKIERLGLTEHINLLQADSIRLPFNDNEFDAITVAFGVRNYEDLEAGLRDMARVLKVGGRMVILEFSKPRKFPIRNFYMFYFRRILPLLGGVFSKDKRAYEYLPESVLAFPDGEDFLEIMKKSGVTPLKTISLTGGIASIYVGQKRIKTLLLDRVPTGDSIFTTRAK